MRPNLQKLADDPGSTSPHWHAVFYFTDVEKRCLPTFDTVPVVLAPDKKSKIWIKSHNQSQSYTR